MSRAAVTLGYLDWALRAVAIGFGIWIAVGALARFDRLQQQQQEGRQVSVSPSPSPSPEVSPSPQPLSPMAIEVSNWDFNTRWQWVNFCQQTRNGNGYGDQEQSICQALSEVKQP